jgi:hypothetical protein
MTIATKLTLGVALFLAVLAAIYWFTSYEDAGTAMLSLGAVAYIILGGYLGFNVRRMLKAHVVLSEDQENATPAGHTEPVGYFPAASVWPAAMGLGVVILGLGLVFGYWFLVLGGILVFGAVIGYAVEAEARP